MPAWDVIVTIVLVYVLCLGFAVVMLRSINTSAISRNEQIVGYWLIAAIIFAPITMIVVVLGFLTDGIWTALRFIYQYAAGER